MILHLDQKMKILNIKNIIIQKKKIIIYNIKINIIIKKQI